MRVRVQAYKRASVERKEPLNPTRLHTYLHATARLHACTPSCACYPLFAYNADCFKTGSDVVLSGLGSKGSPEEELFCG
jgi:hypothetical protein